MRISQLKTRRYFWLLVVLCHFCGGHSFLLAQSPRPDSLQIAGESANADRVEKSPRSAVIRSAIFPGWGQWYNAKKFKAVLVFGVEVGFVSAAIWHNQRVVYWMDTSLTSYTAEYRNLNKNFHIDMRNQFVWYLAGALLVSMADAYVDAHLAGFDESTDLSFVPFIVPNGTSERGFLVRLTQSF
jgi:hypothetical protein